MLPPAVPGLPCLIVMPRCLVAPLPLTTKLSANARVKSSQSNKKLTSEKFLGRKQNKTLCSHTLSTVCSLAPLISKRREKGWKEAAQIPRRMAAPAEGVVVTQTRMLQFGNDLV